MAQTITNKGFAPPAASFLPAAHNEALVDQTMVAGTKTTTTKDTGVVGLKWIRVRALLKTLGDLVAGDTFVVTVQVGTGAALTAPTQAAHRSVTMLTGDTAIQVDVLGWSNAGFQSYAITFSSSGTSRTSVIDCMVDAG